MSGACAQARTRPVLELADIVRAHGDAFAKSRFLRPEERATLRAIVQCRTPALGGHLDLCTACGDERPSYNSCRNRHCPKCQSLAQARWIARRLERILPVHYFHVVFTLPAELRAVAMRSRERVFDMLFASASETLLALARDPKRMGADLGATMVLHTWTRELLFHPHVHAIVTGGGLTADGARWIRARRHFLFPVRVMGALFRGKMLAALERAHARGLVDLAGLHLPALRRKAWVVYAKRPFGGPEQVIRYLGRYTHRVGIANQRLVSMDPSGVTFRTKNGKSVTVPPLDMLARFVEHVLPRRFVKIRHYGLHAASHATTRLELARSRLSPDAAPRQRPERTLDGAELLLQLTGIDIRLCPACHQPALVRTALPGARSRAPPRAA
jgi:putative transposase/transposase-like zinc-binding protein